MPFTEGHIKTGGRSKGIPNKLTREMRDLLKSIVSNELENLPIYLNKLDERERLNLLLKLLPFVIPKVESVDFTEGEPIDFGAPW